MCLLVIPKGEAKLEEGTKKLFEEIVAGFFSNLVKTINSLIQEAQKTLSSIYTKQNIRNIIIKLLGISGKIFKAEK